MRGRCASFFFYTQLLALSPGAVAGIVGLDGDLDAPSAAGWRQYAVRHGAEFQAQRREHRKPVEHRHHHKAEVATLLEGSALDLQKVESSQAVVQAVRGKILEQMQEELTELEGYDAQADGYDAQADAEKSRPQKVGRKHKHRHAQQIFKRRGDRHHRHADGRHANLMAISQHQVHARATSHHKRARPHAKPDKSHRSRPAGKRDESRYAGLNSAEVSTLERMIYAAPHDPAPPLDTPAHYLLFDYDSGGMNNIRIGWEMAGLLAQHTNRTLVLPPATAFYLIPDKGDSEAQKYIDLARLKANLPTLTFEEFVAREKNNLDLPSFASSTSLIASEPMKVAQDWKEWAQGQSNFAIVSGKDNCELSRYNSDAKVLYAASTGNEDRTFGCGDWAAIGQPRFKQEDELWKPPMEAWQLLRNGYVWHPDAYREAAKIVNKMGLFQYVSLHARYNDFQFKEKRQPVDQVIESLGMLVEQDSEVEEKHSMLDEDYSDADATDSDFGRQNARFRTADSLLEVSSGMSTTASRGHHAARSVAPLLQNGSTLYISTDETDPAFFKAFEEHGIKALHWDDVAPDVESLGTPERRETLKGIVEQMVCAYGKMFVATELSTFSSYAQRMRIYADAPVKERLYHTKVRTPEESQKIQAELAAWEAKGGIGAFKPDDVNLVSLAFIPASR